MKSEKQRRTILVVEDEALIRLDLADTLVEMGYRVLEAGNADEAIALLQAHAEIVAVVSDIDMPGSMDGRALAALVRTRWPPCKLILVSGHHRVPESELPPGARFIPKPVPSSALGRTLEELGLAA